MSTKLREYYRHYQQYTCKVSEACKILFIVDIFMLPSYALHALVVYAILNLTQYLIGMMGYSILADRVLKNPDRSVRSDKLRAVLSTIFYLKVAIIIVVNVTQIVLHLKL